jgi:serine protease Do
MTMRKYILTSIALLPLLLSYSHAAQSWPGDASHDASQLALLSSEDSTTGSYLGVDIADVTSDRVGVLKLKEEKGVEVTMVDQDAPAGKAGIHEHDVILTMNGTVVESGAQLRRMIHEMPPGRVVTFGLSRDGEPLTVKVQLADRHKEFSWVNPKVEVPEFHMPDIDIPSFNMVVVTQSPRSGLTVENITPQLGDFFGVKNGNGVLVRTVDKGSRAERAGFHAGDVIVKVNDQPVHDTNDFTRAVRARSGNSVSIGVVRDRKEQNLNLSLPDRKDSGDLQDESFDLRDFDADVADREVALAKYREEIAKMQPQLDLARENARKYTEDARKYAEDARKAACDETKRLREESEKQRELLRKQSEEMKKQIERMRQDLRRTWMDI